MKKEVLLDKRATKEINRLPRNVIVAIFARIRDLEEFGILEYPRAGGN